MNSNLKVCIAMSGGIDSSTAAAILIEKGYELFGVFMLTCDDSHQSMQEAQNVADKLNIKLHIIDMRDEFNTNVMNYFCNEYKKARTPNPCVFCNRTIKFGKLFDYAKDNGADYFSTGHYVKVCEINGESGLYASDTEKDQSYALAMINRSVLSSLIFPLGDFNKNQTRQMAKKFDLVNVDRAESQEICFIPNDDYVSVLEEKAPELIRQGDIIDSKGNVLGRHEGIHRYTIGQRRGLKVAMGAPYYVTKLDAQNNTVTLGPADEVMSNELTVSNINWLVEKPDKNFKARVKIRYNNKGKSANIYPDGDSARIEFDQPVKAITPGQLAVFYIEQYKMQRVAAGAWID